MDGKKFVMYFVAAAILTSIGLCLWIKQGYDSRPQVKIEETGK